MQLRTEVPRGEEREREIKQKSSADKDVLTRKHTVSEG